MIGNLLELRERRSEELPDPIQTCDAAKQNFLAGLRMLAGKCLIHGRRNFVDCYAAFPVECEFVIRKIGEVYKHDRECKERGFDKFQRLAWHVEHSGPIMDELLAYAHRNLDEHLVEPNGELGKALQYLINHWPGLTLFLRVAGCPIDTTEAERALKVPIRNRKNALFFKTQHGATIGDILMSVIKTASVAGVNPFDYLIEIQRYKSRVFKDPEAWFPWNYRATLELRWPLAAHHLTRHAFAVNAESAGQTRLRRLPYLAEGRRGPASGVSVRPAAPAGPLTTRGFSLSRTGLGRSPSVQRR